MSGCQYGSKEHPGTSCRDILTRNCTDNGIYWISLNSGKQTCHVADASNIFPVLCDMMNGGWTLIFKGVAGVSGVIHKIWESQSTFNEESFEALNKENNFKSHYKNRIVKEWNTFNPAQARIVLYSEGKEDLVLTFNAKNKGSLHWFQEANLESSPWKDIYGTPKNSFSLIGDCNVQKTKCRDFYISRLHANCPGDRGWLTIGNRDYDCNWERIYGKTSFLYSKKETNVTWSDAGKKM
ncbi:uncharacterized protein LOC114533756 [Dendronephthya gigantea]|uniref:uncharacterized protein LOC114533756 n=1 Tax=Dendronephthya gigantea TaxID=151771 RepID=UPI00106D28AA|nr:uncharacterized protein LOC114533756 [Dendronephthya gigantea]